MNTIYAFHLPYGNLFLYGDNMPQCKPYIDNGVDCVEDICIYCSSHNLKTYYLSNKSLIGFFEKMRVHKLTKRYDVYSSWDELMRYIVPKYPLGHNQD